MKLSTNAASLAEGPAPTGNPACTGQFKMFFPKASQASDEPSKAERRALEICGRCPVREWCLERDLVESSTADRIIGVRGGLREADRRALHLQRYGQRPAKRAGVTW
ncbi:hypothetical protein E2C11_29090 [Streptomyces lavendulae]|uniref:WhiB family transcriptional regulator n=1 Tax=Streptomyces albus TaxID=1888 RepID=UPI0010815F0A|nr:MULTISPECIES: WhiB family transcriptional regulator [Streptomyces]TXJ73570.1 hypothetical protein E2C11_29090 [Streptomyces lavendulae]